MSEFLFYGLAEDWDELLEEIFDNKGLHVIPNIFFRRPSVLSFRNDCAAFRKAFNKKRGGFLQGAFTKVSPVLQPVGDLGYRVDEKIWGPLIAFFFPVAEISGNHALLLRPGSLSHQSEFWSLDLRRTYRPNDALRHAYESLKKSFKQRLLHKRAGKEIWIGERAWTAFTNGRAKIQVHGQWFNWDGKSFCLDKSMEGCA